MAWRIVSYRLKLIGPRIVTLHWRRGIIKHARSIKIIAKSNGSFSMADKRQINARAKKIIIIAMAK